MIRQSSQINIKIKTVYWPSFLKDVNKILIYCSKFASLRSSALWFTEFTEFDELARFAGSKIIALKALQQSNDDKTLRCDLWTPLQQPVQVIPACWLFHSPNSLVYLISGCQKYLWYKGKTFVTCLTNQIGICSPDPPPHHEGCISGIRT